MKETLGEAITARRQELGISQRELAKAVHISNSTVSRIESDPQMTSDTATLRRLADELQMDYYYLLALNGQIDDEPELRKIGRAMKYMSEEEKKTMLRLMSIHFRTAFRQAGEDKADHADE